MAVEVRGSQASSLGAELLAAHSTNVRAFGGALNALRISPNVMTTDEELDAFLDVLVGRAG